MNNNLLKEISVRLAAIPEELPPDNNELINGIYQDFHSTRRKSALMWHTFHLLESLKLKSVDLFSPLNLERLLTKIQSLTETRALTTTPEITLRDDGQLIVLGDLQGAAHSLSRILNKLHDLKLIDASLTLTNKNHHVVINGNFIGNGHTNFETLIILLYLVDQNPDQVVLIQGKAEQRGDWRNSDLKHALMERCRILQGQPIPCAPLIDGVIKLLPEEAFVSADGKTLYVTPIRPTAEVIFERKIDAIITGRDRRFAFGMTNGLEQIHSEGGAFEWSQFSAPTYINQHVYEFHYDAFTILKPSSLEYTLYFRDVRGDACFEKEAYHLLTGDVFSQAVSLERRKKLFLGITMDFSETASVLGMRLRNGIEQGFHQYNESFPRVLLAPVFLNDKYTPFLSTRNIKIFREKYRTDLVFSPLGTPTTAACLPLVQNKEILVLFPYSGANIFRAPHLDYMAHLRASYESEARALIKYADEELKLKRFAFFYQNDSYGKEPLNAAVDIIKDRKDIEYITASYMRNNPITHGAATKIIEFDPEAIFFFSTYAPSCALIHEINIDRLAGKFLLGISFLTDMIRSFCRSRGLEFIISRVTPPQNDRTVEIVNDFHEMLRRKGREHGASVDALEGFIAASLFGDIVNQIAGDITKENIVQVIQGFQNYNFRGLNLRYDNNSKELYSAVWVDLGK